MRSKYSKNILLISTYLLVFFFKLNLLASEPTKVVYGGFSYGTNLPEKSLFKTLGLSNELFSINNKLKTAIQKINNSSFVIKLEDLKVENKDPENQIVMVIALDDENIFDTIMGDVHITNASLTFRIIFFNAYNNTLVASIPIEIWQDIQSYKKNNSQAAKIEMIKKMYEAFLDEYVSILNNFELKKKYNLRIGIKNLNIEDDALKKMPAKLQKDFFIKEKFATSFSAFISKNNNVALVPFSMDRTGSTLKAKFQDQEITIKFPDPDYYIDVNIKKLVRFEDKKNKKATNQVFYYGSGIEFKVYQPDTKKTVIQGYMKRVTTQILPDNIEKSTFKNFEWFFYNNSLKALFKKISEQTPKSDTKWIKTSTESDLKLTKAFKELNEVYQKCR